jgi:hypothetical protein
VRTSTACTTHRCRAIGTTPDKSARDLFEQSLSVDWIDRPALARRAELEGVAPTATSSPIGIRTPGAAAPGRPEPPEPMAPGLAGPGLNLF